MTTRIALLGCGAVGSQLAMHLASPDLCFNLIDDDRISADNLPTSAYYAHLVGVYKVWALSNLLYRKAGMTCNQMQGTLTLANRERWLEGCQLVLDCFDNVESRALSCKLAIPTLHVGVSRSRTGSITWDEHYKLPEGEARGVDVYCTHLAGRQIIRFTACVAAGIVESWLAGGTKRSVVVTERMKVLE